MNTFQRYLVDEFAEDYQERRLTRRDALKLIASVSGSLVVAKSILAACTPAPLSASTAVQPATAVTAATQAQATLATEASPTQPSGVTIHPSNPRIDASPVEFPGEGATLSGYLTRPSGDGKAPVILVCHENRGLKSPHRGCHPPAGDGRIRCAGGRLAFAAGRLRLGGRSKRPGRAGQHRPGPVRVRFQERVDLFAGAVVCGC